MIIVTGACCNLIKELINRGERNILAVDFLERDYLKDLPILTTSATEFYNNLSGHLW